MDIYSTTNIAKLTEQLNSNYQETIQYQFDFVARKTLIRTQSNCRRSTGRKLSRECPFSEIPERELIRLHTVDTYHMDEGRYYYVLDRYIVEVSNEDIANALDSLPEQLCNILLMFFYLDMSDIEIATLLKKSRSTIYRNRMYALSVLKMELMQMENA